MVISKQPWPDILSTAIAPTPEAVAGAIIISLKIDLDGSNGLNYFLVKIKYKSFLFLNDFCRQLRHFFFFLQ